MNEFLFVCLFKFRLDLKELLQTLLLQSQIRAMNKTV